MRTLTVLAALVGSLNVFAAEAAADARTIALSWDLLRSAQYGRAVKEHSAFLVSDANGQLHLVRWPEEGTLMSATYRGRIPAGTVAILHTHPNDLPNPSPGDEALARKLKMPVYVLTRRSITRTSGGGVERIAAGDWNPSRRRTAGVKLGSRSR